MSERITKTATHETGKETDFSILANEDPINHPNLSQANYGNISRVTAKIQKGERFKETSLVIKHFHGTENSKNKFRDNALVVYNTLKKIGVKNIPSTFRAVGESEIVMTDFNKNEKIAIAMNKIKEKRDEKIDSFSNFTQALDEIQPDLIRAAIYGIKFQGDAFFVIVPKHGKDVEIEIVIADLELINCKDLKKLTDVDEILRIYKGSVVELAGMLSYLHHEKDFFSSHDYLEAISNEALIRLLNPDVVFKVQEHLKEGLTPQIRKTISELDVELARELAKISSELGRNLYADVVRRKFVQMGYDKPFLPQSIDGADDQVAYMHTRSENGSSFGVDTIYLGYINADQSFSSKEVVQTRWPINEISANAENGILTLRIKSQYSDPIEVIHSINNLDILQPVSQLSKAEETLLEMYKNNQELIHQIKKVPN